MANRFEKGENSVERSIKSCKARIEKILDSFDPELLSGAGLQMWPEDLVKKWIDRLEDIEDGDDDLAPEEELRKLNELLQGVQKFRRERLKILGERPAKERTRKPERDERDFNLSLERDIKKLVELGLADPERLLGEGRTAKVFRVNGSCIKVIGREEEALQFYRRGRSVKEEAWFLERLGEVEVRGVRVPKLDYYFIGEEMEILVMETLSAVSLKDVLEGRAKLPQDFNSKKLEEFFDDLTAFVDKMHSLGIYHWDLHAGNVMVDKETGKSRVIDFGEATLEFAAEGNIVKDEVRGVGEYRIRDEDGIKEIRQKMLRFLRRGGGK